MSPTSRPWGPSGGQTAAVSSQSPPASQLVSPAPHATPTAAPTAAEALAFLARAEKELADFNVINSRAQWVNNTYINDDTDALAAYI